MCPSTLILHYVLCTRIQDAETVAGHRLQRYEDLAIQEAAGFIARGEKAQIESKACGYKKRISRHVLIDSEFDDDDMEWLCTTISAFLLIVERSLKRER